MPKKGSVEVVYEYVTDKWLSVKGYDFESGAWYSCNFLGTTLIDRSGVAHTINKGDADFVQPKLPLFLQASGNGIRHRLPFVVLRDALRAGPRIENLQSVDGGFRGDFMMPGGHLFLPSEMVPAWDKDNLQPVSFEVDSQGRLVMIQHKGQARHRYEFDERSPPGVPVTSAVRSDPPDRLNEYQLISVRWFPEGKPELFTLESIRALRESVIAALERNAAAPPGADARHEQLSSALEPLDRSGGRRWFDHAFVAVGVAVALGGLTVMIKRRSA